MLRALDEYEIEGLKTLIPFHKALLATEQWANAETCRDLIEDKSWLKTLAFDDAGRSRAEDEAGDGRAGLHRRGLRHALRRQGDRRRRSPAGAAAAAAPAAGRAAPKRGERKASAGGGADELVSPLQGNVWKVPVKRGRHRRGGPDHHHHRGDEDGERDHRPQGRRRSRSSPIKEGEPIQAGAPIAVIKSAPAAE